MAASICGASLMTAFASARKRVTAAARMAGRLSPMAVARSCITVVRVSTISCACSDMYVMTPTMSCATAVSRYGRSCTAWDRSGPATDAMPASSDWASPAQSTPARYSRTVPSALAAAPASPAAASATTGRRVWPTCETAVGRYDTTVVNTCPTRGATFVTTPSTEPSRLPTSAPTSASGSARPVRRFSHAALAMVTLPSMVPAASLAVVPAIPCASCTCWMAWTQSAKESMERSDASPFAAPQALASAMSCSIPCLVPAYPSLRLSIIV